MLDFSNKTYLVAGMANKKSVAFFAAKTLQDHGAVLVLTVQSNEHKDKVQKLFPNQHVLICDVENENHFTVLGSFLIENKIKLHGLIHSMAYANFSPERPLYHQTALKDFLQAAHISCFSLNQFVQACYQQFERDASIVTVGISNTKATNYGYLGPIKAMLEASVGYLAKSLSYESQIRVNCVASGPLKTSASAGIPNYIDNYLFSEALTLRKDNLKTQEVADTICFLMSDKSSGINGQNIIVDAGMNLNYFDEEVVKKFNLSE